MNLHDLHERVTRCNDFSPAERKLILDCLALDNYSTKHIYPPGNGPGTTKYNTIAWAILDQLPPNAMKTNHRFQLGAMLAGALQQLSKQWEKQ